MAKTENENEEMERKAGYGCELAPKIPEGNYISQSVFSL